MPARRTENSTPDLFTSVAAKAAPPEARKVAPKAEIAPTSQSSPLRHLLPKDLPGALTRLDDSEINALLRAVTDEAKRRGMLPAPPTTMTPAKPAGADRRAENKPHMAGRVKPPPRPGQAPAGDTAPSLTLGQANAVRAAFMAGVKPSTIARQFGISQAAVRQALAKEARGRKS